MTTNLAKTSQHSEDTPAKLRRLTFVNWIIAAAFAASTMLGYAEHHHAIQTLGQDAAPSVVLAHQIKNNLLQMDADAANYLITKPGENMAALKDYDQRQQNLSVEIISAAKNITYGDAEEKPILQIERQIMAYQSTIESARGFRERGDATFMAKYRQSYKILQEELLPAADALDQANQDVLNATYQRETEMSKVTLALTILTGIALISWTIYAQLYISYRFHRRVSLPLLFAALIATVFLIWSTTAFILEMRHLRAAKEDAHDSVVFLMDARASAYDANAAESRWLLDNPMKSQHESMFQKRAQELVKLTPGYSFADAEREAGLSNGVDKFSGSLAKELNNITFTGERQAALDTLHWWGAYLTIDEQIRKLEREGKHTEAVALCIGEKENESNWAFNNFDDALGRTLKINQDAFDQSIGSASQNIALIWEASVLQALLQIALFFIGIRPRLREFNF